MLCHKNKMGTPTDIEEFVDTYTRKRSKEVEGIMGNELDKIPKDVAILDVGCGIGNSLYSLYANNYTKLYGFDFEKELVKVAKKIASQSHLFVGDAENIPLKSNYFDYCTCYDLFEHVKKPNSVIKEINRILKPNGTLYIKVANGYSMHDILFRWSGRIMRGRSSHIQKFKKQDVEEIFRDARFKIEEYREIKGCPFLDFPIMDKIPFSNAIKMLGRKIGKYMTVEWEFKVTKTY